MAMAIDKKDVAALPLEINIGDIAVMALGTMINSKDLAAMAVEIQIGESWL